MSMRTKLSKKRKERIIKEIEFELFEKQVAKDLARMRQQNIHFTPYHIPTSKFSGAENNKTPRGISLSECTAGYRQFVRQFNQAIAQGEILLQGEIEQLFNQEVKV